MTLIYLIIINIITFLIYGLDKYFAKKRMFRISEKILFILSIMGGFLGAIIGMKKFRHKTKKIIFKIVNIISLIIWCVLLIKK